MLAKLRELNFGSKRGQAMIEFLPAIVLFVVVIGTSLVFFVAMRESSYMQEAARNAMFAKIANSGPLVSSGNRAGVPNHYNFAFSGNLRNTAVNLQDTCFSATPLSFDNAQITLPQILGIDLVLKRAHVMSIFRRPGPPSLCN